MIEPDEQDKRDLIERVAGLVRDRLPRPEAALAERFVGLYFRHVAPEDLRDAVPEDLYGAVLGLWRFAGTRTPGAAKLRAYNPTYAEQGWHSGHTVIEIVNDDMPFLVDSVSAALNRLGMTVHLVIHPVICVERDGAGVLTGLPDRTMTPQAGRFESFMHVEVDTQGSAEALARIETALTDVLRDVRAAVEDWQEIRDRLAALADALEQHPPPADDAPEVVAFLRWLLDDHFTLLGYREYHFAASDTQSDLVVVPGSGRGVLRDDEVTVFEGVRRNFATLPPDIQDLVREPRLLMVTKANRRATVHRQVHLDVIIIKSFDAAGQVTGERLIAGLFTSDAYTTPAGDVPYLRRKVEHVLVRAGFDPRGHSGRALTHVLDTYPRDELYQIGEDDLFAIATGILRLQQRQRTALFVRKDPFERFVSCLVYVPRERYDTALRARIQQILEEAFAGTTAAFYTQLADEPNARVHFIVKTTPGQIPPYDPAQIEARLAEAARVWSDRLRDALIEAKGEEQGLARFHRYGHAFPTAYCERTVPQAAIVDIDRVEEVVASGAIGLNLYRPIEATESEIGFKLYHCGRPVALSDVLPMLEHMGLRVVTEVPYAVEPADRDEPVWLHDFACASRDGSAIDLSRVRGPFQEAFALVWGGAMESDGLNRLVVGAGLDWRAVTILRTYARYLRQVRFAFSQDYVETTLATHAPIARLIIELFAARFDPARGEDRAGTVTKLREALDAALDGVANLDEDRILRRFINLVSATLRTNAYQPGADGRPKPYLSIKLDSTAVEGLPAPRPWREIFVYSPRMEGVHLRGGKVARGGLRWSDRREDFRTEVLGLMKAQMVKNAVIVPVGSKGGFVVKRPPAAGGREAVLAEGIECYKIP